MLKDEGTPNKVRIALAPYSSGVNAGSYAAAATGLDVSPCTFERDGADIAGNAAPEAGAFLKTIGSPGVARGAVCPDATIVPLTKEKATLISEIERYEARGSTAGHLGTLWAWYMLSDTWNSVFGGSEAAPFHDGKTKKALVLMTDGLFNTLAGIHYGDSSPEAAQSQQTAKSICQGLRDNGVTVYTVGFKLKDISSQSQRAAAAQTLVDCAGSDLRYFDADDPTSLRDAFVAIAKQLNNLRLTQ